MEELALWEYALFGNLQPSTYLAPNGTESTMVSAPDGGFQVNQSHYVPEGLDQLTPDGVAELPPSAKYTKDEEHGWFYGQVAGVSADQMQQFKDMLLQHKSSFAYSMKELPGYNGPPAEFTMVPNARAFHKRRQYSPLEKEIQDEKCAELLEAGFIIERDTRSDFAACPTMPAKKDELGHWTDRRFCQDYRDCNSQMVADNHPLPLPEELFRSLKGAKYLSKIDMRSGFLQIPIHPDSQHVTAFWWGSRLFQYTRVPFGIKTSVAIFQRIMETVIQRAGLTHCAHVYVDDILVHSRTFSEHIEHVAALLQALHAADLRAHPAKSVFVTDRVEYLGHMVTPDGMEPVAAKVAAMANLPVPKNKDDLRKSLGLLNYYRNYIVNCSAIAKPLSDLLCKNAPFVWGDEQQRAFEALKAALCTPGMVLKHPRKDRPFILHTDWSTCGISAVLGQLDDQNHEYMVACISRSLNEHERKYEAWKGELLAGVWGMKSFRVYLHGRDFEIVTDHRPLLWLLTAPNPAGQQARWILSLQEYDFTIRHRPGTANVNADVPSRFPLSTTVDVTGARLDSGFYNGPLPKVVFGPVGSGTPVQPYRLEDAPPELQLDPAIADLAPAQLLATMAYASLVSAARYDQFVFLQAPSAGFLDEYDCRPLDLWETSCGTHLQPLVDTGAPVDRIQQELLQRRATQWVQQVSNTVPQVPACNQAGLYAAPADDWGVKQTLALCTASVASTYHTAASSGIVLCELFGGICAGLEMALRNGVSIHTYIYVDHDPICQAVACYRISQFMAQFPHLLPATAVQQTFSALPSDVWQITSAHLAALSARLPRQWLVVGGWACQDLSPAGPCTGIQGSRSNTFYPMLQIIGALQQLQQRLPPAYLIENTAFQHNWKSQDISQNQYQQVCNALGSPVCLDAAQFGSYAHRLRNYWTNLCDLEQLLMAAAQVTRAPNLQVQDILSPGRQANACCKDDQPPYYPANVKGKPLSALPTIVAYPGSYAFRPGEPGAIYDASKGQWSEPTADECERAMGYASGTTAAAEVTEQQRRALMGRCMDANVLQSLYAISLAWYRLHHWAKAPLQLNVATYNTVLPKSDDCAQEHGVAACLAALPCSSTGPAYTTIRQVILTTTAEVSEQQQLPSRQVLDVWKDEQLLYYLKEQQYKPDTSNEERTRVRKRAALYVLAIDGRLFRVLADGSKREVPKPEQRQKIITEFHEQCGHYGVRRTAALVQTAYWWHGVLADVANVVSKCNLCGRVRSSFNAVQPTLNPLPINGMFYRAGCDLAGPFNKTARGAVYAMVVIEYHSKFLTIIPIPDKRPCTTAAAFAQHILGRYGSFAEVVTDRGTEWQDEFAQLLCDVMIDHRRTSAGHPEADGLCERAVQTAKRALRKLCAQRGHKDDWDLMVPFVMLGYNCSPQKSTGFAPYMLMYARVPTVPPAIRERLSVPVDFGSQELIEAAAADYLQRAELVKRLCIIAGDNLRIAQHRDTLRYAAVRSGSYVPKLKRFEVGDYVYVSRAPQTTLTIKARPVILRVKEVRSSGVLTLEGRCGRTVSIHMSKCAPCHLPDIDPRIDPTLAAPDESVQCEVCHSADDEEYLLLCDKCNRATHLYCAVPPLEAVPPGIWLCSDCLAQGFTASQVEQQRSQDLQLELQQQRSDDLTPAQKRAKQLHGRLVVKTFYDESTNLPRPFWGKLYFVGPGQGPNLLVQYEDQDSETCTLQTMRRKGIKVMPEGTELPAGVRIPEPVSATVLSQQLCSTALSGGSATTTLPTHWDLQTQQGVARALSILLPGEYAPSHITRIANSVKAILMDSGRVWVPTVDTELEPLARLVDFSACHSFLDPFAGSGSIAAFFASMGYRVLQNDLDPSWPVDLHCDALQPSFYAAYPAQVIVSSPPFCVLDIAVPLVSLAASVVACIHVPGLMAADEPSCTYCLLADDYSSATCYCEKHGRCVSQCDRDECHKLYNFIYGGAQADDQHPTTKPEERPSTTDDGAGAPSRLLDDPQVMLEYSQGAASLMMSLMRYGDITRATLTAALAAARPEWDPRELRSKTDRAMAPYRDDYLRNILNSLVAVSQMVAAALAAKPAPSYAAAAAGSSSSSRPNSNEVQERAYGLACHNHGLCNHVGDGCGVQTGGYVPLQPAARPFVGLLYSPKQAFCVMKNIFSGVRSGCFPNQREKSDRTCDRVMSLAVADSESLGLKKEADKIHRCQRAFFKVNKGKWAIATYSREETEAVFAQENPGYPTTAPLPPQAPPVSAPADALMGEAAALGDAFTAAVAGAADPPPQLPNASAAAPPATDSLMGGPEQHGAVSEIQRGSVWQRLGSPPNPSVPTDPSHDQRWLSRRLRTLMLGRGDMLARYDAYGLTYVQGAHYPSPVVVHNPAAVLGIRHYGWYNGMGFLWQHDVQQWLDLSMCATTDEQFSCVPC